MGLDWLEPAIFLVLSGMALAEGLRLAFRHAAALGVHQAGWYVVFLGAALLVLAAYAWIRGEFLRQGKKSGGAWDVGAKRVGACLLILAASAVLVPWLGYMLSTVAFFLAYFRLLGGYRWPSALLLSGLLGVLFAVVFAEAGMMLPQGIIPWP